ncbi:fibronectin type III domain-containing protein [Archangium violaceum]|uniref:fibronectin type III domain-containing protein n=1 Tax=Archangium violaceum TaxID=83451 RepID=UPI001EF0DDA3|nr:fibronectin type III domain-containing protein [Archangium violaceum]
MRIATLVLACALCAASSLGCDGPASDTQPPTAPGALTGLELSSSAVELSWSAATDNVGVTGYLVLRDGTQAGTVSATELSYRDSGLASGTTYSYTVKAQDAAGNVSPASNTASTATRSLSTDATPPSAPNTLKATAASSGQVNLTWGAATDDVGVTGYILFRDGTQVGLAPGTALAYQDGGLVPNTSYSYTVKAQDAAGNVGPASNVATATTLAAPTGCGCTGNPGTLTRDVSGPCIRYAAPSGAANDIVFRFDSPYTCGTYVNGDYWVVVGSSGRVNITGISPAASGGRHGAGINPDGRIGASQSWDSRFRNYKAGLTFPYAAKAGDAVIKYVSRDSTSTMKTLGQFAAVVTVLAAPPADPANEFRPPYVGTYRPVFSATKLRMDRLSRLPNTGAVKSNSISQQTAEKWTQHLRLDYTADSVDNDIMPPADANPNGKSWSGDIWQFDTELLGWLNLADVCGSPPCTAQQDNEAKLKTLIGYVQHGIDVWATQHMGVSFERGGGGNGAGKLLTWVWAATLLDEPQLSMDFATLNAGHFFETSSYYRGANNVALWGQLTGSEQEYWDDVAAPPGLTKTIRDPYGYIDGGAIPGTSYQDNTAMQTKYTAMLMRLMPALRNRWPLNASVILDYADRWVNVGAWAKPDPCAPRSGTYGVNYGPNGSGSCVAGSGRFPTGHGYNKDGGNRSDAFGNAFWSAYRACAETCTCPNQSCVP